MRSAGVDKVTKRWKSEAQRKEYRICYLNRGEQRTIDARLIATRPFLYYMPHDEIIRYFSIGHLNMKK
jgi:hypothetical protein